MKISTDGTNSILNNIAKAKLDYVDLAQKKEANPKFEKLKKAAQNFEAIFITQILSNMRRGINSGLFGQGMSSDMYHSMFDENIAQAISSKGGFGLSDIIIKSLHKDTGQEESAERPEPPRCVRLSRHHRPSDPFGSASRFMSARTASRSS